MSHGLDKLENGNHSMAFANYEMPWHGLGVPVDGLMTSQQALEKSGLDFEVAKKKMYVKRGEEFVESEKTFELVRTDTMDSLGVCGNTYQPYQNHQAFQFLDDLTGGGKAMYDTAGAIFNGARTWILCKLPNELSISGDEVKKFLLISNSHDGKHPIVVKFTDIRVVCWNTLSASLRGSGNSVRIRHTRNAGERMEEASKILGISQNFFENRQRIYSDMANFNMNKVKLNKFITAAILDPKNIPNDGATISTRAQNTILDVQRVFESSPVIVDTPAEGNLWGAYNAVTEWAQYHRPMRKNTDAFDQVVLNDSTSPQHIRNRALNAALEMMKN